MPEPKESTKEYAKGYQAGRRYVDNTIMDLRRQVRELERVAVEKREERIYFSALNTVLTHCRHWSLGEKEVKTGEDFNKLAKIFAKYAITSIEELENE
jgi:hypothetical protein